VQPPSQLKSLDDLLAQAEHYANYSMRNIGRLPPTLFLIGPLQLRANSKPLLGGYAALMLKFVLRFWTVRWRANLNHINSGPKFMLLTPWNDS
jgi:hypothetical protein